MSLQKPTKLTKDEFVKTATMFYLDVALEKKYSDFLREQIAKLQQQLSGIVTKNGVQQYVSEEKEALENLTSLLNISSERFKRIVSMLRIARGHQFDTEWTLSTVRTHMLDDSVWMDDICDLLINGAKLPKYQELIPSFYLENFKIDITTIGRLANPDDIRRLIKRSIEGRYNNQIGDSYLKKIRDYIIDFCGREGFTTPMVNQINSITNHTFSLTLNYNNQPWILIDITYAITTSSGQSRFAREVKGIADKVRQFNENNGDNKKIVYINIMDGAGWVARSTDLDKIISYTPYVLNLNNLSRITDIINFYA
ncbi:MAG: hypothetical protein LBU04_05760 [Christensenellaceae bacterium]|jgi:hypothetical protein|nr:hypothetical protein [Christensenellaceae bacterium]